MVWRLPQAVDNWSLHISSALYYSTPTFFLNSLNLSISPSLLLSLFAYFFLLPSTLISFHLSAFLLFILTVPYFPLFREPVLIRATRKEIHKLEHLRGFAIAFGWITDWCITSRLNQGRDECNWVCLCLKISSIKALNQLTLSIVGHKHLFFQFPYFLSLDSGPKYLIGKSLFSGILVKHILYF